MIDKKIIDDVEKTPIHGDILEVILSNVPLIDLVSACCVSKSWARGVSSSLIHFKQPRPWLVIHSQNTISNKITTNAYDPRSNTWIEINKPLADHSEISARRSSCSSNLVLELFDSGLSYSSDPLHIKWAHIPSPKVWRVDPIVAQVGRHIIVAGGAPYWEDDHLSVEMYDVAASDWSICQSMPDILKDWSTSMCLSVASNQKNLYVTQKSTSVTYSFSPNTKTWSGPYNLCPNPRVFFSAITFGCHDLILAGLTGHAENVKSLKLWKINLGSMKPIEISEIPSNLLVELKGEGWDFSSISLLGSGDFIYIYKNSYPSMIIYCENVKGEWLWGSFKNMVLNDANIRDRMVMNCTKVGINDLDMAMKYGHCKFIVKG